MAKLTTRNAHEIERFQMPVTVGRVTLVRRSDGKVLRKHDLPRNPGTFAVEVGHTSYLARKGVDLWHKRIEQMGFVKAY